MLLLLNSDDVEEAIRRSFWIKLQFRIPILEQHLLSPSRTSNGNPSTRIDCPLFHIGYCFGCWCWRSVWSATRNRAPIPSTRENASQNHLTICVPGSPCALDCIVGCSKCCAVQGWNMNCRYLDSSRWYSFANAQFFVPVVAARIYTRKGH